jgi:hypothetical protein
MVSAPAHWLEPFGTNAVAMGIKGIGILLGLLSVLMIFAIVSKVTGSRIIAILATLFFSVEPTLLFSVLSGMETALLITLFIGASYSILSGRLGAALLLLSLTPVTRPEAALVLPFYIAVLYVFFSLYRLKFGHQVLLLAALSVPSLAWSAFCRLATGHFLPNTFYMKAKALALGMDDIMTAYNVLTMHGYSSLAIFWAGLVFFVITSLRFNQKEYFLLLIFFLVAPAFYLFGILGSRDMNLSGYYWLRWADPAILLLGIGSAVGYAAFLSGNAVRSGLRIVKQKQIFIYQATCVTAGVLGIIVSFPGFAETYTERRDRLASDSRAIHRINVQAGRWIHDNTEEDAVIAVNDAGAIRFFGRRKTIDIAGLNNHEIAFRRIEPLRAILSADYLAIFPSWFGVYKGLVLSDFSLHKTFQISAEEYTVCDCPYQSQKLIFRKKH